MSFERIAVIGTGANGASIAADLVRAGLDVTLIEQWPSNVDAMREHGLTVVMPNRTEVTEVKVLHLCEIAELKTKFDLVLMLVKAYDTRWAAELIKPILSPEAIVVGLQNGMTVDDLEDVLGPDQAMGAVIEVCSNMFEPGVAQRETAPEESWFALGGLSPTSHARSEEVATILRHSGSVQVYEDIRSAKWMKLVANAAELVPSAILNIPLFEAVSDPKMRSFMEANAKEALSVCIASGSHIVPIFGFTEANEDPDTYAVVLLDEVLKRFSFPGTLTTVLQDWRKGRRAEIHEINGMVVREGKRLGIPTPANSVTLKFAQAIEAGNIAASPENLPQILENFLPS